MKNLFEQIAAIEEVADYIEFAESENINLETDPIFEDLKIKKGLQNVTVQEIKDCYKNYKVK